MKSKPRLIFVCFTVILLFAGALFYRASIQRLAVRNLLNNELVAVQFADGEYVEDLAVAEKRTSIFDSVDVVYLDTPGSATEKLLPFLKQLPNLDRIILRYQGEDLAAFKQQRKSIEKAFETRKNILKKALPGLEVLSVWAVVETKAS